MLNYPKHKHPHGIIGNPNISRVWVCEDCKFVFSDVEIRQDAETGEWGHKCKSPCGEDCQHTGECRCESHLEPYLPELFEE